MRICFVTEIDIDREAAGGVMTERKMLDCLAEFGEMDIVYLETRKLRSTWLALVVFVLQTLRSFCKPYQVYFSRGLVSSFLLVFSRHFYGKQKKIIHRTVMPFVSLEVRHLRYGKLKRFVRSSIFSFLEKHVLFEADVTVVPAKEYIDQLVDYGLKKEKIHVIPFYVEDEFFRQPIKKGTDSIFKFCYVSGFHSYHDFFPLVEAFDNVDKSMSAILLLVGDGELRPETEKRVQKKHLEDKVKFVGKIPHSAIPSFLGGVDAFISLAHTPAISTSLLEAAAAGKPIITARKESDEVLNHYFRNGKEIYMMEDFSPMEIQKALTLIYTDARLRGTLAAGARNVARLNFSRENAVHQVHKLMEKVSSVLPSATASQISSGEAN